MFSCCRHRAEISYLFVLGRGASQTEPVHNSLLSAESSTSGCVVTSTVRVRTKRCLRRGSRVSRDDGRRPQVYLTAARRAGRGSLAKILSCPRCSLAGRGQGGPEYSRVVRTYRYNLHPRKHPLRHV